MPFQARDQHAPVDKTNPSVDRPSLVDSGQVCMDIGPELQAYGFFFSKKQHLHSPRSDQSQRSPRGAKVSEGDRGYVLG